MSTGSRALGEMGARARWHAWSHSLMGSVARIDYQVSLLLALADARTNESAFRLLDTYQRVGLDQRTTMLAVLPDPVDNAGAFERVADWVSRLAGLRNQLAHSVIVDAESDFCRLDSVYRGRHRSRIISRAKMGYAHKMARESWVSLDWLTPKIADVEVWGHVMGFDDDQPDAGGGSQ